MPHRAMLTPEDDFFGRVALFNNLITLDQIVESARTIGAEMVAGRPRRSLATTLILKGYLSAKAAGAVEAAVRRHHAKQAGGEPAPTAAPTPKPPPMADHAPSGHSQIVVTLEGDDNFVESSQTEDRLRQVVTRICPGLIYPEMLAYVIKHRLTIVDGRQLAAAISEPETEVFAALRHWQTVGILKKVGTHPYCYSPAAHDEQDVTFLMDAWHDPHRHARVLGFILAAQA
jgi:hypothetical protein